jgi:hypothetical protein
LISSKISGFDAGNDLKVDAPLQLLWDITFAGSLARGLTIYECIATRNLKHNAPPEPPPKIDKASTHRQTDWQACQSIADQLSQTEL